MPADTNPAGDMFGGRLLAQMNVAAENAAVAVDALASLNPVAIAL